MNSRIAAALGLALLVALPASRAATLCRITSAGGVLFGAYDVLAATATDTVNNIVVACDRDGGPQNISVVVQLNAGTHGGSVSTRRMRHSAGGADYLDYGLYRDVGRTATWGFSPGIDTVSRQIAVPNKGTASTTFPIYGRIPARQDVRAGAYADSVQVTITP